MKTQDKNVIIAEFMGVPQGSHTHFMIEPFSLESYADVDDLKYDISWDWLMPVIEEIDHLQYESIDSIENALATRSIKDTYKAVVKFLGDENLMNHSQFLKWREEKMEKWGETEAEFEESHRLPADK